MVPSEELVNIILAKAMGMPASSVTTPSILVCAVTQVIKIRKKTERNLFIGRYKGQLGKALGLIPIQFRCQIWFKVISNQKKSPKKSPANIVDRAKIPQ